MIGTASEWQWSDDEKYDLSQLLADPRPLAEALAIPAPPAAGRCIEKQFASLHTNSVRLAVQMFEADKSCIISVLDAAQQITLTVYVSASAVQELGAFLKVFANG